MNRLESVQIEEVRSFAPNEDLWGSIRVNSAKGNRLELIGWVVGASGDIRQVEIVSGYSVVASAIPDHERPELATQFPGRDTLRCGFLIALEAEGRGTSTLAVRAAFFDGRTAPLAEMVVTTFDDRIASDSGRGIAL